LKLCIFIFCDNPGWFLSAMSFEIVNTVLQYYFLVNFVNVSKTLKWKCQYSISMIMCQVHFWLQRSDIVYLLVRIACKEKYVFFQLNLFPECLNHLYHRSPIPLIRIEELLKKKRELKSLLVISSGTLEKSK